MLYHILSACLEWSVGVYNIWRRTTHSIKKTLYHKWAFKQVSQPDIVMLICKNSLKGCLVLTMILKKGPSLTRHHSSLWTRVPILGRDTKSVKWQVCAPSTLHSKHCQTWPTCLIWRDVPRLGAEDLGGPGRRAAVLHRHAGAQRERGAQAGAGGADHAGGQVSRVPSSYESCQRQLSEYTRNWTLVCKDIHHWQLNSFITKDPYSPY